MFENVIDNDIKDKHCVSGCIDLNKHFPFPDEFFSKPLIFRD